MILMIIIVMVIIVIMNDTFVNMHVSFSFSE